MTKQKSSKFDEDVTVLEDKNLLTQYVVACDMCENGWTNFDGWKSLSLRCEQEILLRMKGNK